LRFWPVFCQFPSSSRCITGTVSHILIRRSIRRSTIRLVTVE
jgi:hypothetical protein